MSQQNTRATYTLALTLATDATSPEIPYEEYASGEIFVPTGSSITTLTWYVAPRQADQPAGAAPQVPAAQTWLAAYDATPAAVTQTVSAAKAYPIPAALAGAAALQCRVNAAGAVTISLKS